MNFLPTPKIKEIERFLLFKTAVSKKSCVKTLLLQISRFWLQYVLTYTSLDPYNIWNYYRLEFINELYLKVDKWTYIIWKKYLVKYNV